LVSASVTNPLILPVVPAQRNNGKTQTIKKVNIPDFFNIKPSPRK